MVQDTSASPEVYLSQLDDGSCGGWGIYENSASSGDLEEIFDYSKLKERGIVWAITVPGTPKWLQEVSRLRRLFRLTQSLHLGDRRTSVSFRHGISVTRPSFG